MIIAKGYIWRASSPIVVRATSFSANRGTGVYGVYAGREDDEVFCVYSITTYIHLCLLCS